MKSICIKTNNSNLLDYLYNEFKLIDEDNICFSLNEFKNFKNIIIHYNGDDLPSFIRKVSSILSYLVIDEFEEDLLKNIIFKNYFYFDNKEKEQILMALQGISATENSQSEELLIKLGGLFQSKVTNWIEVDFSEWYKNTPKLDTFNLIKRAIFNRRTITFSYFAREGNYSKRTVEPIKLIFKNKDWYLYGFCLLRNDFRFFKLTRIKDLIISSDTFVREVGNIPEIETTIKNENMIPAKLKFSPQAAFRVYDEFTDNVSKDNQGNLYVNIDLPDNETLFSYILSFGDNVEIIEPDYLRQSIKEKKKGLWKK